MIRVTQSEKKTNLVYGVGAELSRNMYSVSRNYKTCTMTRTLTGSTFKWRKARWLRKGLLAGSFVGCCQVEIHCDLKKKSLLAYFS